MPSGYPANPPQPRKKAGPLLAATIVVLLLIGGGVYCFVGVKSDAAADGTGEIFPGRGGDLRRRPIQ